MTEPPADLGRPATARVVCITAILLVVGLLSAAVLYPWISAGIGCRDDREVRSGMQSVLLGMHNYQDAEGALPAIGSNAIDRRHRSSWRFRLVPWLDAGTLGPEFFEKPWDSADRHYRTLRENPLPVYCFSRHGKPDTKVFAITGEGTAFPKHDQSLSFDDLDTDTILIVTYRNSGVHWMAPGDLPIDKIDAQAIGMMSLDGCGFHVGFADGAVWRLSNETPAIRIREFATVEGAKRLDRDSVLSDYRVEVGGQ